jgi:hypothetical protein
MTEVRLAGSQPRHERPYRRKRPLQGLAGVVDGDRGSVEQLGGGAGPQQVIGDDPQLVSEHQIVEVWDRPGRPVLGLGTKVGEKLHHPSHQVRTGHRRARRGHAPPAFVPVVNLGQQPLDGGGEVRHPATIPASGNPPGHRRPAPQRANSDHGNRQPSPPSPPPSEDVKTAGGIFRKPNPTDFRRHSTTPGRREDRKHHRHPPPHDDTRKAKTPGTRARRGIRWLETGNPPGAGARGGFPPQVGDNARSVGRRAGRCS